MLKKIRHTGIVVRDIEKLVKFYETLGFKTQSRQIEEGQVIEQVVGLMGAVIETAKMTAPCGGILELLQYHSHPLQEPIQRQPSNQLGCSHIALTVKKVSQVLAEIEVMGGSRVNDPALIENKGLFVVYCHDPEGNLLELVEES
jgi:predicted enzyme related to lactoylglutathione lyase